MKFLLPALLAAPVVMGRACRARSSHSTALSQSTQSQEAPQATVIPENNAEIPSDDSNESPVESVVVTSTPAEKTTLATSASPKSTNSESVDSVSGTSDLGGSTVSGSSTFYGGNLQGGACLFSTYTLPSGIYGTAFSGQVWNNGASCGACIEVTGPSGTITAMIVDKCPECDEGHLDLFPDAFTAVGGTDGIVDTSYKFVSCGITSPLILKNKEGTSPYWFSMQVSNADVPVESLEVSTDGGSTWQSTTRTDYNFFENTSGFGTEQVDVKVTSTTGKSVTVKGVSIEANLETKAGSNF